MKSLFAALIIAFTGATTLAATVVEPKGSDKFMSVEAVKAGLNSKVERESDAAAMYLLGSIEVSVYMNKGCVKFHDEAGLHKRFEAVLLKVFGRMAKLKAEDAGAPMVWIINEETSKYMCPNKKVL
jgi:hypothetical protein